MPFRYVDLDSQPSGYPDFAAPKRSPTLVEQVLICFSLILTGVITVLLIHDAWALIALLFTAFDLGAVYVTQQTHRNRQLLQATEFQNALFASALARKHRFCLIARKDGGIVYANPQFKVLFPGLGNGGSVQDWRTRLPCLRVRFAHALLPPLAYPGRMRMHLGSSLSHSNSSTFTQLLRKTSWLWLVPLAPVVSSAIAASPNWKRNSNASASNSTKRSGTTIAKLIPFAGPKAVTNPRSPDAARGTPQIFGPHPRQNRSTGSSMSP